MWQKIVNFFYKLDSEYFYLDPSEYEYLGLSSNKLLNITLIIVALAVGIIIASVVAYYNKTVLGAAVRVLSKEKAYDNASALTLEEMKIKHGKRFFERAINNYSSLGKYVKIAEPPQQAPISSEINSESAKTDKYERKYFLPKEFEETAVKRYSDKGSDLKYLLLTVAVVSLITVLLVVFRREVAYALNTAVGFFKNI